MKVILTGGGTGGHIYPALAVAKILRDKGWNVLYIGSKGGLEGRLVPSEGFAFQEIDVAPLPRKLNTKLFSAIIKTIKGMSQAKRLIKDFQPDIVLGTGGFVAGPVVLAASLQKIPTIIHEQNVYPGFTNKLLSYRVNKIAVNFADAEKYFSKSARKKIIVTGNPIRKIILKTNKESGLKKFALKKDKKNLLVFGGSQGAMSINKAMLDVYQYFKDSSSLQIIHITGEAKYDLVKQEVIKYGIDLNKNTNYKIIPYLKNMEFAYAVADLIIYRAGATGIAEITAKGIPAILIPYPFAAENHQEYNARSLERKGAAIVIKDNELTGQLLIKKIEELIYDQNKLNKMKYNSEKLGQFDAGEKLVVLMEELIGEFK